jgi:mRNA-degrading endonuclease toxin of MazEF toxin-antitoxin module
VIVSNARICADNSVGIVVAVPMTHDIMTREATEVVIRRSAENGLECDSSAMLHLIQPVLKTNIKQKVGMLNAAEWDALVSALAWMVERE